MVMPVIKTIVGGQVVIHSEVVHINGQDRFDISINGWICTVRFKEDDGASRYSGVVEDGRLYVDLYNHKNTLGESITTPFVIAQIGSANIWMTYRTTMLEATIKARSFEYALWMDNEDE